MTVLVVSAAAALVVLLVCLRRSPLLTLTCVALLGLGLHSGTVRLPAAITRPAAQLSSSVQAWQHRQTRTLSCDIAQAKVLVYGDESFLDQATRLCSPGDAPQP